ncbi:MAG: transcription termination factor Rho [Gemmatimonadaceae bacterium]|nr:transcription termination factor Rho [Gemmatimonadaceae bacterium]
MTERRRPAPGRGPRSPRKSAQGDEPNPYKDSGDAPAAVKSAVKSAPASRTAEGAAPEKKPRASRAKKPPAADATVETPPPPVVAAPVAADPAPRADAREPRAPRERTPRERPPREPRTPAADAQTEPRTEPRAEPVVQDSAPSSDTAVDRVAERGPERNADRPVDRNERRGRFQRRRGRGRNRFREGAEGGDAPAAHNAPRHERGPRPDRNNGNNSNNNNTDRQQPRNERHERGPRPERQDRQDRGVEQPGSSIVTAEATITGWYDPARGDGGFIRRGSASYLPTPGDPFIPGWLARQFQLRRADLITAAWGHDQRRRPTVCEITSINEMAPDPNVRRKDFKSLTASYPNKRLTLETGRPAKVGPEITRRAIDLIAPIGYGQRALIVAPARAGKTTLLQAITEGVHLNHPDAILMLLLVDERPEEVSEAISWEVGEVIASSFDQPAQRHVDVTEIVTERAHRLVEMGKDVVIVLDSITRMGRAFNTANRGTGRTMSGGLDANAMAKPKAFFGSARNVAPEDGGGSLTIIATALVETGSRMDDVIFEEFKGTGNCEIKLDRGLAERRIFPAIDIPASGTRREEKLYKPEQVQSIYMLRRGLQQMPPMGAMEWLIKRIAATPNNDALLAGL